MTGMMQSVAASSSPQQGAAATPYTVDFLVVAGGGGGSNPSTGSASGGPGTVIIRYLGAQRGTGGTVTSSDAYTYHTFTESGTYIA